jgi:hypothetical protein
VRKALAELAAAPEAVAFLRGIETAREHWTPSDRIDAAFVADCADLDRAEAETAARWAETVGAVGQSAAGYELDPLLRAWVATGDGAA